MKKFFLFAMALCFAVTCSAQMEKATLPAFDSVFNAIKKDGIDKIVDAGTSYTCYKGQYLLCATSGSNKSITITDEGEAKIYTINAQNNITVSDLNEEQSDADKKQDIANITYSIAGMFAKK